MEDNEFEEVTIISHTDHGTSVLPQSAGLDSQSKITLKVATLDSFKSSKHFAKHLAQVLPKNKKLSYPVFQSVDTVTTKLRGLQQEVSKRHAIHHPSDAHLEFISWHEDANGFAAFVGNTTQGVFVADPDMKLIETVAVAQTFGSPMNVLIWNRKLVVVYSDAPLLIYSGLLAVDRRNSKGSISQTTKHQFGGSLSWHTFCSEHEFYFLSSEQRVIRISGELLNELDVTPGHHTQVQDFAMRFKPKPELICLDSLGNLVCDSQQVNLDELYRSSDRSISTKQTKFVPHLIRRFPIGLLVAGVCLQTSVEGFQNGLMLLDIASLKLASVGSILCSNSEVLTQFRFCAIGPHKLPGFLCRDEEMLYVCSVKIGKIYLIASVNCMWITHISFLGPLWMLSGNYDSTNILTMNYNT